jgi:hypothetical protein
MRKCWITLLFTCFIIYVNAQSTEDVIYLKNGSVLRGRIVEHIQDSIVKIMVTGGTIWALPVSDVASFSHENSFKEHQRLLNKKTGFNMILNTGLFFLESGTKSSYFHVSMINSWSIWPNFSVGFGGSIDRDVRTYCPLYLDTRYYFNRKYFAPFITVSCGKALPWDKEVSLDWRQMKNYGGLYFSTGIGIEFPQNENLSILLGLEYKFQRSTLKSLPENDYYELIEDNNRIGVKFGVLFN